MVIVVDSTNLKMVYLQIVSYDLCVCVCVCVCLAQNLVTCHEWILPLSIQTLLGSQFLQLPSPSSNKVFSMVALL